MTGTGSGSLKVKIKEPVSINNKSVSNPCLNSELDDKLDACALVKVFVSSINDEITVLN